MNTIKHPKILKLVSILFIIGLCFGCSPIITETLGEEESTKINVSFAGGGWRAHTGHSAWVMSLLAANHTNCPLSSASGNPQCLDAAFTNVNTISANSGGSWFSTMLMYDTDFVNQITGTDAFKNWGDPVMKNPYQGWLGKQQNYFEAFKPNCGSEHGTSYLECVLKDYFSPSTLTPSWSELVEKLVYKGYNWQAYRKLGTPSHLPWAKNKSLLMAGTWLTNSVVLNDEGSYDDELYYQVCKEPHVVKVDGDDGAWCLSGANGTKISTPDVWPVTFSSLAENNPTLKAPSFIGTTTSSFHLGYTGAYATSTKPTEHSILQSGINKTDNIPVMWAAAASSAATGYTASYNVLSGKCDLWDCVYHARNLALGFTIPQNTNQVTYVSDSYLDGLGLNDLKTNRAFRVADGGAIDNSGIAQLITFLQINGQDNNFEIVAFDDIQRADNSDSTKYPSSDISYLFEGAKSNQVCIDGLCVQVPELAVVELDPDSPNPITKHTWTVIDPSGNKTGNFLYYYTYQVQTVANTNFNIKKGSKGVIRVFASEFDCADTGPENNDDFACYNSMLKEIKTTLRQRPDNGTSSKNGLAMLMDAFGL